METNTSNNLKNWRDIFLSQMVTLSVGSIYRIYWPLKILLKDPELEFIA